MSAANLTEVATRLSRFERRARPSRPPWRDDTDDVFTDWCQMLMRYDLEHIDQAFATLRDNWHGKWPSYYEFEAQLRNTRRRSHKQHRNGTECDHCGGGGWQPALTLDGDPAHIERNGLTYTYAHPCACPAGQQAERSTLWKDTVHAER